MIFHAYSPAVCGEDFKPWGITPQIQGFWAETALKQNKILRLKAFVSTIKKWKVSKKNWAYPDCGSPLDTQARSFHSSLALQQVLPSTSKGHSNLCQEKARDIQNEEKSEKEKNQGFDSDEKRFLQRLLHTPSKCQLYKRGLHKAVGCTVLAAKFVRIWWIRFFQTSQVRHTRQDLTQVRASSKTHGWQVSCKVSWSFCAPRRLNTHSLRRQLHLLVSGTSWSDIVQPMSHLLATPAQNWEDLDSETLQTPCFPMRCRFCTCYISANTYLYIYIIIPSALCISALRQSVHLFPSPHLAFPGAPWELLGFALSTCAAQSHVITSRKLNNTHHT